MPASETFRPVDFDPFADGPVGLVLPTTPAQREVWMASQLSPELSCSYNLAFQVTLEGRLDREALAAAAAAVADRHQALRGSFTPDGQQFCIAEAAQVPIEWVEPGAGEDGPAMLEELRNQEASRPFDLGRAPLLRIRVLALAADRHVLLLTAHHSIADGWSCEVILRHLGEEYASIVARRAAPARSPVAYSSWIASLEEPERQAAHREAIAWWKGRFDRGAPVLELPTDYPRPAERHNACRTLCHDLDPAVVARLRHAAAAARCTLFVGLVTAFAVFLRRLSGQRDLVIGIPAAGQAAAGQPDLVGHCTNLLPLRLDVADDGSFDDTLRQVKDVVMAALEHQHCTFSELLAHLKLQRDASRAPLVSVTFNVDRIAHLPRFGDLEAQVQNLPRQYDNFEWTVNVLEKGNEARVELTFNAGLYAPASMERRLREFETLVAVAAAEPAAPLASLDTLPAADRELQLGEWNATSRAYPDVALPAYLAAGFTDGAAEALVAGDTRLSFAELEARANRLAQHLGAAGARRGDLVGLSMHRSAEMPVALLAILKAGCAYLPLDPAFPAERLAFMLQDANVGLLVTETDLLDTLPPFAGTTVCVDRDAQAIATRPDTAPEQGPEPDDRAYVIYTSGSTGKPKGVEVLHKNVVNFLHSMAREPGIAKNDRLLAVTTLSFDISVLELMLPLAAGATCILASRETAADAAALADLIERENVSLMQATPATWRMLVAAGWHGSKNLRILCGGEALPRDLAQELLARSAELWNLYGPTETTVWSTCRRIDEADGPVLIGRPIDNTRAYVLDEHQNLLPVGVYGELYLGGDGVTRGYLGRPELTAERFLEDPFFPGERIYRTGDRVRWHNDGQLEYHSRIDNQVKVRGFRIELGEIETALAGHPDLAESVVVVREDTPGDQRLVAYYVPEPGQSAPTASELRSHLRASLPDYMLPQHFVELKQLPTTPNNKIDRKALPGLSQQGPAERAHIEPSTPTETALAELWRQILGNETISADDNFFDLGGHSLASVQVIAWARKTYDVSLHPLTLVTDTLAGIAAEIDRQHAPPAAPEEGQPRPSLTRRMLHGVKSVLRKAG